ncbi:hypothetical protein DSO57_1037559 [Entomophthora muscae]|uniref:Uncharacterized protein n=1 Tax=Entomophthora muscae TaxID=34485 RepID=A0ACC2U8K0_9FUNG|nr:hypothetical protein DSO57_1037559 [Entomophthora muscae]
MRRFAFLGTFGHLAMVTVPIGLVVEGLNLGALAHKIGDLFPLKWVPDIIASKGPEGYLQQFPLIGETAAKQKAASQPAAGSTPPIGAVHPRQMGKLPRQGTKKGNFPNTQFGGNCCPNLESTNYMGLTSSPAKQLMQ